MAEIEITPAIRQAVLAEECLARGHSFITVVSAAGDPQTVMCERCPRRWKLVEVDDR